MDLKNLEQLPEDARNKISRYARELINIYKDNILSIYIYGSAASGDYAIKASDANAAVVFKNIEFLNLKKCLRLVSDGIRKRITAPLLLTPEYIKTSCDTFPIEFLDMKESHILIHGEDFLNGLEVDPRHIRFVCEQQLKGKLLRIRQAYLEIGLCKKGMEALIKESLNSLFPVFRALLRIKGIAPARTKRDALISLGEVFSIDADAFIAVLGDKKNDEKIQGQELGIFLAKYLNQIEKLAYIADKL